MVCLQDDIADRVLPMLEGAMAELLIGNPDRLSVDVGPVITAEAQQRLLDHIARMRAAGHRVFQAALTDETRQGTFVPTTIIEIDPCRTCRARCSGPSCTCCATAARTWRRSCVR